jgi:hypothetical protein
MQVSDGMWVYGSYVENGSYVETLIVKYIEYIEYIE